MGTIDSKIDALETSRQAQELIVNTFSKAKVRIQTYKLNEIEEDVIRLHSKEWAIENFFIKTTIAGVEHCYPDPEKVKEWSVNLHKLAKVLDINMTTDKIEKKLNSFNNSHTLIPIIDNYVYAVTNTKNIKIGGILVIKLSASFGRKVFSIIRKSNKQLKNS